MEELAIGLPGAKYRNLTDSTEVGPEKVVKNLDILVVKITVHCCSRWAETGALWVEGGALWVE